MCEKKLLKLRKHCNKRRIKILLSNDLRLAKKLNYDGVYLPSFNNKPININHLKKKFILAGSAHNILEVKRKEKQNLNLIFVSPLFETKNKNPIGIIKFRNITNTTNTKIIALGGINCDNIKKLNLLNVIGFGSITYIKKKYTNNE